MNISSIVFTRWCQRLACFIVVATILLLFIPQANAVVRTYTYTGPGLDTNIVAPYLLGDILSLSFKIDDAVLGSGVVNLVGQPYISFTANDGQAAGALANFFTAGNLGIVSTLTIPVIGAAPTAWNIDLFNLATIMSFSSTAGVCAGCGGLDYEFAANNSQNPQLGSGVTRAQPPLSSWTVTADTTPAGIPAPVYSALFIILAGLGFARNKNQLT